MLQIVKNELFRSHSFWHLLKSNFWPTFLFLLLRGYSQGILSLDECIFQTAVSTTTARWKNTCVGDSHLPPVDSADWSPTFSVERKKFWIVNWRKCRNVNQPLEDHSSNHKVGEPVVGVRWALSPEIDRDPRNTPASPRFSVFLSIFLIEIRWKNCETTKIFGLTQKSFLTGCPRWCPGRAHVLHTFQLWYTPPTKCRLCCCKIVPGEPRAHGTRGSPPPTSVASRSHRFSPIRSRQSSTGPDSISAGSRASDLDEWFGVSAKSRFQWEVLLRVSKTVEEKEVSLFSSETYRETSGM